MAVQHRTWERASRRQHRDEVDQTRPGHDHRRLAWSRRPARGAGRSNRGRRRRWPDRVRRPRRTRAASADVVAAIAAAGGTVISRNTAIGTFTVLAPDRLRRGRLDVDGRARRADQRAIGRTPGAAPVKVADPEVEQIHKGGEAGSTTVGRSPPDGPPGLARLGPDDGQGRPRPKGRRRQPARARRDPRFRHRRLASGPRRPARDAPVTKLHHRHPRG